MKFDNLGKLASKLSKISYYPDLFNNAFFSTDIDSTKIQTALTNLFQILLFLITDLINLNCLEQV